MSELFDIYQQNISSIFKKINKNIDNLNISKTEKVEFELSEADKNIKEADKIVIYTKLAKSHGTLCSITP